MLLLLLLLLPLGAELCCGQCAHLGTSEGGVT